MSLLRTEDIRGLEQPTEWTESEQKSVSPRFPFCYSGSRLGDLCGRGERTEELHVEKRKYVSALPPWDLGLYVSVWSA